MSVWLGGLPDCYLQRANGELEILKSNHLPIGVLRPKEFDIGTLDYQMDVGDRFYLWSDGIHEARNELNVMYGEDRLMNLFLSNTDQSDLFSSIKNDVTEYIRNGARDDDITMLEVMMVDSEVIQSGNFALEIGAVSGPTDWCMSYSLGPGTLKDFNPLPLLLHLLMEVPGLRPHSGTLYTVLAELYSNALEHGVIGLDSHLKSDPAGFGEYYAQRQSALVDLNDGFVKFTFEHVPTPEGGILKLFVEDSGTGFEYKNQSIEEISEENFHGRGIQLLKTLCREVRYMGVGNEVEATFEWQREA